MKKPNVIHISTHDTGKFFGCYGINTIDTPHIDQLAQEGVLCENMFCVSPICSPSRGSAMTGLYPQKNGLIGLVHQDYQLNDNATHLAQYLQREDYETALFSFQHETESENWERLGFDHYLCRETKNMPYPYMFKPAPDVAQEANNWLSTRKSDKPFYAQIGFNETHTPFHFGGVYPDKSKGVTIPPFIKENQESEDYFAHLQGAINPVDEAVGIIMNSLRELGLEENTILVFTTDHGIEVKRSKWTLYDPGIEIAHIVRWPAGNIKGGTRLKAQQSNINFTPTILDLCGLEVPSNLDGHSVASWLQLESKDTNDETFFGIYHNGSCRCIRTPQYKFIRYFGTEIEPFHTPVDLSNPTYSAQRTMVELYDLETDPNEFDNLAQNPEYINIRKDFDQQLYKWLKDVDDPILKGPEPHAFYQRALADFVKDQ